MDKIKLEDINKRILKRLERENSSQEEIAKNIPFYDELSNTQSLINNIICSGVSSSIAPTGIFFPKGIFNKINKAVNNESNFDVNKGEWGKALNDKNIDELMETVNFNKFSIHLYLNNIKLEKGLTMTEIMQKSNFKDKYLSGVFTIKKTKSQRHPSRDCIIGLCFAFELNLFDSNYLLKSAGYNDLYLRNKRDLIIAKSILENKDIQYVNKYLQKYGEEKIGNFDDNESVRANI